MTRLIPLGAEERMVQLAEGPVRVLTGGNADDATIPVVLIHGGGTDNAGISWFHSFAALGGDRGVIAVDLPGFGGTKEVLPVGGPGPMADFVVRVADAMGVSKAAMIGVSMGGDVALNVALRHPERTAALVLIAPGGLAERVGGRATHFLSWLGAQLPDWLLLPLARVANRFSRSVLKAIVEDLATLPPEVVDEFVREARGPRAGIGYGRYNQETIGRTRLLNDLTPRLHEIGVPTLLFHGESDRMVDPADSRRAAELIPDARLVLVPRIGHWVQLEAPDLFAEETRRFLAAVEGAPGAS
ncbi:alpha/beta fold hydrolase [Propioniciclava coleopterorum]|uniref:Alpha/beta fold hydrolase n=1 Tax=Propioniciclava coleopterorum TaxID=2714937 RepID=A0A6G7Y6M9_9ACTN|nr:alpha/beta fold hydrolase [Propioniciclava coleopterorum]QIK72369.1 alpha/beta fold hydrolase [Propioniciclava coleopterorum]